METLSRYYASYQEFKQMLDVEMQKTVEGFVKIGFLLNFAAETNIVEKGGYANVNDFAKAEYGIEATQVSRFINIYKRFGVPGEPRLQDQYMNHGVAKLGIMLTLPDFLNEQITEDYSKSEINTLKHEYEAEQKVSDIEVAIERAEMKESVQYTLPQMLTKAVYQLIHDEPATYARLYDCIELDDMKEILAPMGENSYIVRIKGIGRLTIFLKNAGVDLINLRDGSKEDYSWQQLFDAFKEHFAMGTDAKDSWSNVFQEPYPEEKKEEPLKVADKPAEKAANTDKNKVVKQRKESRVKVVTEKKPIPAFVQKLEEMAREKESAQTTMDEMPANEEQIPGQDSILNHPELLPDDIKEDKPEVLTGEVEDITVDASQIKAGTVVNTDNDNVQQAHEGMKVEHIAPVQQDDTEIIRANKAIIRTELRIALDKCEKDDWAAVYAKATDIVMRAKKNMELEGKK